MSQNRRDFIKTSAAFSAAAALLPSCITSTSEKGVPEIGLQLYTVRDQMAKDPEGTLERVAKIGYKKIETAGYADGKVYGFPGEVFAELLDGLGLEFVSGHIVKQHFEQSFDQVLEFLVEAGQQYAILPWLSPEERSTLDQYKQLGELLNRCAEKAQPAGVTICYHNHDFEFVEIDGELPMNVLISELDPKLVSIELDLYWVTKAGLDPLQYLKMNKGRIPLWHVKDMADTPEKGFAEVGEGIIDYPAIFDLGSQVGMKHFFVEQDQSDDPMKSIETSYVNLTKKILV